MKQTRGNKKVTVTPTTGDEMYHSGNKFTFFLPPGVKFSDVYMDAPQVAEELNVSKRTVSNMRTSGKVSFTTLFGKLFYFRQELAGILVANKIAKKGKPGVSVSLLFLYVPFAVDNDLYFLKSIYVNLKFVIFLL